MEKSSSPNLDQSSPATILLLDDSLDVRAVLHVALESEGYSVVEAADGREGVRLYHEHRPALVLDDIRRRSCSR